MAFYYTANCRHCVAAVFKLSILGDHSNLIRFSAYRNCIDLARGSIFIFNIRFGFFISNKEICRKIAVIVEENYLVNLLQERPSNTRRKSSVIYSGYEFHGKGAFVLEEIQLNKNSVLGRRIGAFIIDHIVISLIAMLPFFLNFNKVMNENYDIFKLFFDCMLIGLAGYLLKDVIKGRSIGKILFGLYVKDYQHIENTPPAYNLIIRNLLIFIWPVEFIIMLADKENRRLGDKIGKTRVVGYSVNMKPRIIVVTILGFILFASSLFIGVTQIIRNNDSYKTAVNYIENRKDIKKITGQITGYGYFPSGSISFSNGYGIANISIKVKGEKQDLKVFVLLVKNSDSDWEIKDLKY